MVQTIGDELVERLIVVLDSSGLGLPPNVSVLSYPCLQSAVIASAGVLPVGHTRFIDYHFLF